MITNDNHVMVSSCWGCIGLDGMMFVDLLSSRRNEEIPYLIIDGKDHPEKDTQAQIYLTKKLTQAQINILC
jgi:hypothetical protein